MWRSSWIDHEQFTSFLRFSGEMISFSGVLTSAFRHADVSDKEELFYLDANRIGLNGTSGIIRALPRFACRFPTDAKSLIEVIPIQMYSIARYSFKLPTLTI
jgi:hypothetical protein